MLFELDSRPPRNIATVVCTCFCPGGLKWANYDFIWWILKRTVGVERRWMNQWQEKFIKCWINMVLQVFYGYFSIFERKLVDQYRGWTTVVSYLSLFLIHSHHDTSKTLQNFIKLHQITQLDTWSNNNMFYFLKTYYLFIPKNNIFLPGSPVVKQKPTRHMCIICTRS